MSTSTCRGCGAELGAPFLDLGRTPLANSYVRVEDAGKTEARFPLAVCYCEACHLVQLERTVDPRDLFSEYLYFSSYSSTFLEHAKKMASELCARYSLGAQQGVLEIASNDGYLLRPFQELGVRVLGVEPARNIAEEAERRGVPTLNRFFGAEVVQDILARFGAADLIVGNNVLAHVPGIVDFLRAARACLSPRGVAVFEFPELGALLDDVEFDTIYHEHVFYLSLTAIIGVAKRAGLEVFDVSRQPVHGRSLRVHLQSPGVRPVEPAVEKQLADEELAGITSADCYLRFRDRVEGLREALVRRISELKASGKRVAAYGAPAKGNTLLSYCGIDNTTIDFTVDRSPHKQGLLLPGSRIPILAPDELLLRMPDVVVILPWNLADEIIGQQRTYLERGGAFLIPIPEPRTVER